LLSDAVELSMLLDQLDISKVSK